jgi:hypothetical protein
MLAHRRVRRVIAVQAIPPPCTRGCVTIRFNQEPISRPNHHVRPDAGAQGLLQFYHRERLPLALTYGRPHLFRTGGGQGIPDGEGDHLWSIG